MKSLNVRVHKKSVPEWQEIYQDPEPFWQTRLQVLGMKVDFLHQASNLHKKYTNAADTT